VTVRLRRFLLDTAPLRRDRDYRWLWSGQVVNGIGTQITRLALPFQVYTITGSTLAIGALTGIQLVAILVVSLGAGSLADALDRRRLLRVTQTGLMLCSGSLVLLSLAGEPPLVALFAVAFIAAGLSAVDQPTRTSAVPRLVPPERLAAALSLNALNFQAASIVGPALAGVLIATIGLTGAYAVDTLTFIASLGALTMMRPLPPDPAARRPGLAAIREGLSFVRQRRPILGAYAIDLVAMVFAMPTALFPALALDVYRVGPTGLGFLAAAPAAGAFVAALFSGWLSRVTRIGRMVVGAVVVWGIAIAAFGLATVVLGEAAFPVALATLAIAGAADMYSAVLRNTIMQLATPDALRGRVTSINTLVVVSGPRLGDLQMSIVAAVAGPATAILAGGLLCLAGTAVVVRALPEFVAHTIRRPPDPGSPVPSTADAPAT
jgi:MFS family permease